jgi:DNA-directed RNA polymerase specialized sigma24 family protein
MVASACLNFLKSSFHRFNRLTTDIDTAISFLEDPAPSPAERLERLEIVHVLRKSLSAAVEKGFIRHDDALLFELRLGGMSYSEISRLWGVSAETLGTRFHRLKGKIKKHLQFASSDL